MKRMAVAAKRPAPILGAMGFVTRGSRPDTAIIREGGYQPTSDPGPVPSSLVGESDGAETPFQFAEPGIEFLVRVSDALKPADRRGIIEFLSEEGEASDIGLARALDKSLATMRYSLEALERDGLVEVARMAPRKGAVEHFFRLSEKLLPLFREASATVARQPPSP